MTVFVTGQFVTMTANKLTCANKENIINCLQQSGQICNGLENDKSLL